MTVDFDIRIVTGVLPRYPNGVLGTAGPQDHRLARGVGTPRPR